MPNDLRGTGLTTEMLNRVIKYITQGNRIKAFIARDVDMRKLEIRSRSIETILPNRLQAYERMCLFLERI